MRTLFIVSMLCYVCLCVCFMRITKVCLLLFRRFVWGGGARERGERLQVRPVPRESPTISPQKYQPHLRYTKSTHHPSI